MSSHRFCGSCTGCSRQFRQRKQLVQHRACHTLEKKFSCICGNSYKTQNSLKMHMRRCTNVCTTHKILRILFVFEREIDKHSVKLLYMNIMKDHLWIFKQILALYHWHCRLLLNYVTDVAKPTKIAKTYSSTWFCILKTCFYVRHVGRSSQMHVHQ